MRYYDVTGYDRPLLLSEEHAELIGATEHAQVTALPARNAPVQEWRDYALTQGADAAAAEGMTRAALIETYGG
jgi:hypothetical protein